MLARRLTTMLPAMTLAAAIETTRIHRVASLTGARTTLVTTRPFRAPQQTISDVGLIGGGHIPMPGEGSRVPHGVRFVDELPEFRRHGLEVLHQPLEESITRISSPASHRPRCSGRTDGAAEPLHPLITLMSNGGNRAGNRRVTPVNAMDQSHQGLFWRHLGFDECISSPSQANCYKPLPLPPLPSVP